MISLRSKISQKILNLFFLNEGSDFYVNELANLIGEDPANVHKKLNQFAEEGLLAGEFRGKERYFSLVKDYPFLKEYKKIVLKGFGIERMIKEKVGKLGGIESVIIFGSYAKDKLSGGSDIDILVIGDFNSIDLQKILLEVQKLSNREINSVEMTKEEFDRRKRGDDAFLKDILDKEYIKVL